MLKEEPTEIKSFNEVYIKSCLEQEYGIGDEQENPEDNQFDKGVEMKKDYPDYFECSGDFLTNYAGLKRNTIKTEDDIDTMFEDVHPEIYAKKSGGKSEIKSDSNCADDILMETTKTGPSFPHELSIDLQQQNTAIEEDETDAKKHTESKSTILVIGYQEFTKCW
ncbi:hypothetical protein JTB14_025890 [Gonioctena quinquepunctata]|nr:hypothetical protein JTB14_025890 [Gonioctena quinquepunctata]